MGVKIAKTRKYSKPGKALVSGAAVDTNIAIAGIKTTDEIVAVHHYTAGTSLADVTSEANITSDGNIQLDTTDTSGDQLIVDFESADN